MASSKIWLIDCMYGIDQEWWLGAYYLRDETIPAAPIAQKWELMKSRTDYSFPVNFTYITPIAIFLFSLSFFSG